MITSKNTGAQNVLFAKKEIRRMIGKTIGAISTFFPLLLGVILTFVQPLI